VPIIPTAPPPPGIRFQVTGGARPAEIANDQAVPERITLRYLQHSYCDETEGLRFRVLTAILRSLEVGTR